MNADEWMQGWKETRGKERMKENGKLKTKENKGGRERGDREEERE